VTLYGIDAPGRHGKEVGHTWIDIEDASAVGAHRWRRNSNGYASTKIEGKPVLLHRLLLNPSEAMEIDHIDGDRLNNRRSNLRVVTHKQNMQNKPTSGATGHRGVFYEAAKGLYRVLVIKDGVRHSGGRHKNLEDAIAKATALRAELLTHHNEDRSARNDD
jgi:hypothetical protein